MPRARLPYEFLHHEATGIPIPPVRISTRDGKALTLLVSVIHFTVTLFRLMNGSDSLFTAIIRQWAVTLCTAALSYIAPALCPRPDPVKFPMTCSLQLDVTSRLARAVSYAFGHLHVPEVLYTKYRAEVEVEGDEDDDDRPHFMRTDEMVAVARRSHITVYRTQFRAGELPATAIIHDGPVEMHSIFSRAKDFECDSPMALKSFINVWVNVATTDRTANRRSRDSDIDIVGSRWLARAIASSSQTELMSLNKSPNESASCSLGSLLGSTQSRSTSQTQH